LEKIRSCASSTPSATTSENGRRRALELAQRVDVMLVIGGHNSANTRHLYELCEKVTKTYHVETDTEINRSWLAGAKTVGVTSGASTDEAMIEKVIERLKSIASGEGG